MPTEILAVFNWKPRDDDLPIFRADQSDCVLFYAPGYLVVTQKAYADDFEQQIPTGIGYAEILRHHARKATQKTQEIFAPVCLTLYLNTECNLYCRYCYAMPSVQQAPRLKVETVQAAAELVAKNCQNRPLTVVFHGGGEPTLDQTLATEMLDVVEAVAASHHLAVWRYIATNGVISPQKAHWLAERFDLIGISCDGPPPIQDSQRPRFGGGKSSQAVEQTAAILHEAGKPIHIRVTVTQESASHQPEIAAYLCEKLHPQEIHVEPVYGVGRAARQQQDAERFVSAFWQAREVAKQYGVRWMTSGSRPDEIHNAYCNVFRQVLQLVPGDGATACFKTTTSTQAAHALIGKMDSQGIFSLNTAHIDHLQQQLTHAPIPCHTCFNRYHCVQGCPEFCPLETDMLPNLFRCHVQRLIVNTLLRETASHLLKPETNISGQAIKL